MANPRFTLERGGETIELAQGENLVGRGRSCAVVISDPSVSRSHALVNIEGERTSVTDLGSANGTYVNGERVTTERYLSDGDQILFGETELMLRISQIESIPLDTLQPDTDEIVERSVQGKTTEDENERTISSVDPRLFFCSECGADLDGSLSGCPECGHRPADPPLSQSEAISVGEVLPVGELLAASDPDLLETGPRLHLARRPAAEAVNESVDERRGLELVKDRPIAADATEVERVAVVSDAADREDEAEDEQRVEATLERPANDYDPIDAVAEPEDGVTPNRSAEAFGGRDQTGDLTEPEERSEPESSDEFDGLDDPESPEDAEDSEGPEIPALAESFDDLNDSQEIGDSAIWEQGDESGLDLGETGWLDETTADDLSASAAPLDAYPLADSQAVGDLLGVASSDEAPSSQAVSDLLGSPRPKAESPAQESADSTAPVTDHLPTIEETIPVADSNPRLLAVPLPPNPATGSRSQIVDPYRVAVRSTPPGGFWRRLAAWIVDGLLVSAIGVAVSLALGGPTESAGLQAGGVVASILGLLIPLVGWAGPGTTPGKRLFDLWVCNPHEEAGIGLGRAIVRLLGYALGAALLGIGFLMIPFNASKRGLHDFLAGTRVIVGRP